MKQILGISLLTGLMAFAFPAVLYAQCSGSDTPGDDTRICSGDTMLDIAADSGNDELTVNSSVTLTGAAHMGVGNDFVSNNGTITGGVDGSGGDDAIIVWDSGSVGGNVDGDV